MTGDRACELDNPSVHSKGTSRADTESEYRYYLGTETVFMGVT